MKGEMDGQKNHWGQNGKEVDVLHHAKGE